MKNRKFKLTVALAGMYTLLLVLQQIDKSVFAGLMGSLVPLYFAANVSQKVFAPAGTAPAAAGTAPPAA